jgi:hypothetical protein
LAHAVYEHSFAYNQTMRLWLLQPRPDVLLRAAHPWEPPEDKVMGLVVRAPDESDARFLAQAQAGYEGAGLYRQFGAQEDEIAENVWLDPAWTSCEELESEGDAGVVLVDRREA